MCFSFTGQPSTKTNLSVTEIVHYIMYILNFVYIPQLFKPGPCGFSSSCASKKGRVIRNKYQKHEDSLTHLNATFRNLMLILSKTFCRNVFFVFFLFYMFVWSKVQKNNNVTLANISLLNQLLGDVLKHHCHKSKLIILLWVVKFITSFY